MVSGDEALTQFSRKAFGVKPRRQSGGSVGQPCRQPAPIWVGDSGVESFDPPLEPIQTSC